MRTSRSQAAIPGGRCEGEEGDAKGRQREGSPLQCGGVWALVLGLYASEGGLSLIVCGRRPQAERWEDLEYSDAETSPKKGRGVTRGCDIHLGALQRGAWRRGEKDALHDVEDVGSCKTDDTDEHKRKSAAWELAAMKGKRGRPELAGPDNDKAGGSLEPRTWRHNAEKHGPETKPQ